MTKASHQFRLLNRLNVIQIHSRGVLETFVDPDDHLARGAADRGGDGREHGGIEHADDLLTSDQPHRSAPGRTAEYVQAEFDPCLALWFGKNKRIARRRTRDVL